MILDVTMPGRSGLDVLADLKQLRPKLPILILSMHPISQYGKRVLKAGASGYMSKESAPEELIKAVRKVLAGSLYVSPVLAERLAADLRQATGDPHGSSIQPRTRGASHARFGEDRESDRGGVAPKRGHRGHASRSYPGKDEYDDHGTVDPLRTATSSRGLKNPASPRQAASIADRL